jgi:hypothetical protein
MDKLSRATGLGLMLIDLVDPGGEDEWGPKVDNEEELVAEAIARLLAGVPYPFDYFSRPDKLPGDPQRFSILPWGGGDEYIISDSHNLDEHVISRELLLDQDFDLVHWLSQEKEEIKDTLYDGIIHSPRPMPEPLRQLLEESEWTPVAIDEGLEEMADQLRDDLLLGIPYSFDSEKDADLPSIYSPDRFEVETGHHPFVWVTDHAMDLRYRLSFQTMMEDDFEPALWLEGVFRTRPTDGAHLGTKEDPDLDEGTSGLFELELSMARVTKNENTISDLQRNAARMKDLERKIPKPPSGKPLTK